MSNNTRDVIKSLAMLAFIAFIFYQVTHIK